MAAKLQIGDTQRQQLRIISVKSKINPKRKETAVAEVNQPVVPFPRLVRPAPRPFGLYIRSGRNDRHDLLNLIQAGDANCFGLVLDPTLLKSQAELRDCALSKRLDVILDPRTQASATVGGFTDSLGKLPWGIEGRPHILADFEGTNGRKLATAVAAYAVANGFTQVLAPSHLIRSADDPWLGVDVRTLDVLRDALDKRSQRRIPIIHSLAISYAALRDPEQRAGIVSALRQAPIDAAWMKVDGFGSQATPTATRAYIDAMDDFRELGVPLVADHAGGLAGLSLLAFGSVGGLAHGVTVGERFSANTWRKARDPGDGFGLVRRVYFPELDLMLKASEAQVLFERVPRARAAFACHDSHCCPRGMRDMLESPARHFLIRRAHQVAWLGQVPESLRPSRFLEEYVRDTSDKVASIVETRWSDAEFGERIHKHRKRMDAMRGVLAAVAKSRAATAAARVPETRAVREHRPAS